MSRARVALATFTLSLALATGASSATAETWPDGLIIDLGRNSTLGWRQVRLLPAAPDTFHLSTLSYMSTYWREREPMTSSGGFGAIVGMATNDYATDHDGNLVYLRFKTSTLLELGAVAFSGAPTPTTDISGGTGAYTTNMLFSCAGRDEGGAWFMWQGNGVRLLRAAPGGTVAPGWLDSGWKLADAGYRGIHPLAMASDGEGGVLALLCPDVLRVHRVSASPAFAPGWPDAGLALETAPAIHLWNPESALVRSGATHFIAVWAALDPANTQNTAIKCQRFSLDGALDPAWPAAGRVIVNLPTASLGDGEEFFKVVPDGDGGVTVAWIAGLQVWASHVLAGGLPAPGYVGGPRVLADLLERAFGLAPGPADGPCVVFAGEEWSLRARWFDGNGDGWPSAATSERVLFTGPWLESGWAGMSGARHHRLDAVTDGAGGAYIAWTSALPYPYNAGDRICMTHAWWSDAPVAVPPPASSARALAAGPNPARGEVTARFALPDARPARLELLDLAGRRVAAREVSGAGAHAERFGDLGALAPGVYLLRLVHGGAVRTARVAVIR